MVDDTWDPAAFFAMVSRRWTLVRKGPSKLNRSCRTFRTRPRTRTCLKSRRAGSRPSAVAPLSPLAGGLPGNASAATAAGGLGKGGKGGKGASTKRNFKKTAARRGKGPKGAGACDLEGA